jgi:hypothetical protein
VKDVAGNALTADVTWTFTIVAPPTVTSFTPAAGANEVNAGTNVTVTFSEAMDATTVNVSTVELQAGSNPPVTATVNYDAGSFTATLNPDAPLSPGVEYTARVRGGSLDPRVKDVAGNALAADVTWTFTIIDPPRVLSTTPADGDFDVPTGVAPRARFSKQLDPASVNTDTVLLQLNDTMGTQVPINVAYSATDSTIAIVPQGLLQPLQFYTVTLKGGPNEPHITDTMGRPLAADFPWTFRTAAAPPPITGLSVFAPSVTPANPISNDPTPLGVELGMKFRSENDGLITGVRFYKGDATNGGTHVGNLWIPNEMDPTQGTLLGSVTFTNETVDGWQQALFQTPILITADTTYVVSYFAPQRNYAADFGFFASEGEDNPPLHALQDGIDGGNGVFRYSDTGGLFPNETGVTPFNAPNFYVDVVFRNTAVLAPQVLSTTPTPGAIGVPIGDPITVTFSEPINPISVTVNGSVLLTDTANNTVDFDFSFGPGNFTLTLTPTQPLQTGQAYTVTLKGGDIDPHITDATGIPLAADFTWSFITESDPAPASTKVTMSGDWVPAGGNFIAMRPDKQLASLLRLNYASSVLSRLLKPAL